VAKGLCVICGAIGQNKTSIMALSLLNWIINVANIYRLLRALSRGSYGSCFV
jgi:hypothetical protein